jgi:AraC-like DNA-binding protein
MQLGIDSSGPVGLIDVLPQGMKPVSPDDIVIAFPPAFGTGTIQRFTLSSLLFVMLHRYTLSRDVQLRRRAEPGDPQMITFSFRNMVRPLAQPAHPSAISLPPSVQVSSSDIDLDFFFPAGTQINTIIIGIDVALLTQLMGQQAQKPLIQTLLGEHQTYLYEEFGSLTVQQIAADLMARYATDPLVTFYLTVKAQELIYQFMSELLKRETKAVYLLRDDDGKRLFAVRDQLVKNLSQAPGVPELAWGAGMSESKLRRLFRQVFGMSLYDYYQTVRMHEAARLLREANLSVSETGYRLGFTNLSHFTRVFEKHLGQKPKQYTKSTEG